jgi:hypothetical protein
MNIKQEFSQEKRQVRFEQWTCRSSLIPSKPTRRLWFVPIADGYSLEMVAVVPSNFVMWIVNGSL